jgi:hypothetical protein
MIAGQTLQMQSQSFTENLLFDGGVAITIKGGHSCDYSSNNGFSTIHGNLTIATAGTSITIERVIIQ